jgi:hypothetical protein
MSTSPYCRRRMREGKGTRVFQRRGGNSLSLFPFPSLIQKLLLNLRRREGTMSTFISLPPTPGGGAQLKCQRKPFSPPPGAGRGNARSHWQREISAFSPSHSGLSGGAGRPCQRWDFLPPGAKGKGAVKVWQRTVALFPFPFNSNGGGKVNGRRENIMTTIARLPPFPPLPIQKSL